MCNALGVLLKESRFFPKIAEIREKVLGDQKQNMEAEADAAWLRARNYADRYHPDVGSLSGCGTLTQAEDQSLRIAGGRYMLWTLIDDGGTELAFMRKAFIEAYKRASATSRQLRRLEGGLRAITDGEGQTLDEIMAKYEKK